MLFKLSEKFGPLGPILILLVLSLYGFFINRVLLSLYHLENTSQLDNILPLFITGARTDLIILCLSLALPTLILFLSSAPQKAIIRVPLSIFLTLLTLLFLLIEIISWPFMNEFSSRPNQFFFQYFTHPKEVFSMLWNSYALAISIALTLLTLTTRACWTLFDACIAGIEQWQLKTRLLLLLPVALLLALGARSGIGEATANPSIAAFSNNHIANQIALNGSYSLTHSIYRSQTSAMRSKELYGDMPKEEVISRVKKYMALDTGQFLDDTTYHVEKTLVNTQQPKNLVIIIVEGLSAKYVGFLNGGTLTPNLDRLSRQGIIFNKVSSIGTRTSRGIEAMVSGYPPSAPSSSILKMDGAQHDFFTVANMLKPFGYHSSFIYGGEKHFDNMASFFLGNGFNQAIGLEDYVNPVFRATWGVSDEDTFAKANEVLKSHGQPFVSVILTLSNHKPHDYPDGRVELAVPNKASVENTVRYTDYAIGKFFEMAQQESYYKDTVFVLTADHPYKVHSTGIAPVNEFWIPGLILNSSLPPQTVDKLASQMDLLPTVSSLLGIDLQNPMLGKNLLSPFAENKLVNIMLFNETFMFRTQDKVVAYRPNKDPIQYRILANGELEIDNADPELIKDGLAHILFPSVAYNANIYKKPANFNK